MLFQPETSGSRSRRTRWRSDSDPSRYSHGARETRGSQRSARKVGQFRCCPPRPPRLRVAFTLLQPSTICLRRMDLTLTPIRGAEHALFAYLWLVLRFTLERDRTFVDRTAKTLYDYSAISFVSYLQYVIVSAENHKR